MHVCQEKPDLVNQTHKIKTPNLTESVNNRQQAKSIKQQKTTNVQVFLAHLNYIKLLIIYLKGDYKYTQDGVYTF